MPILAPLAPVIVDTEEPEETIENNADLSVTVQDNGNVVVDLNPRQARNGESKFDENLALTLGSELSIIANNLMEGIEADLASRREWETTRARGIELLGLKLEEPRGDVGTSSAPLEGMSTVRHPLLNEACLRFWANACGELLPAEGPGKIREDGQEGPQEDELADALEKDFNHYLTVTDSGYYPDTRRMIYWTGFGGSGFKKVYHHPLKRRPVSEAIDANDFICSNAAADIQSSSRNTHRMTMRQSVMKRMQLAGIYRDVTLGPPSPDQNAVDQKKERIEGVRQSQDRPEDQPYTLYESYCEYSIQDDPLAPAKFKDKNIPLPYRITLDKDSREVLEIRRNWLEDDEECEARETFVKYPFIDAIGFYGMGFVHVLGNSTNALTAAWRETLDAGMFANFPAFAVLKDALKQLTNEFRLSPGGAVGLQSPGTGRIQDAVMALPYKDVTPGILTLIDKITEACKSLGMTADLPVGEGRQDAPVGTTLALLEQATKVESAVHKGLHTAQSKEFQLLKERFREDPEAFWRFNKNCSTTWDKAKLEKALDDCDLVPVADPNTPSHIHRLMKVMGVIQMGTNPALASLFNLRELVKWALIMAKVDNPDALLKPEQPAAAPPPDPKGIADVMTAQAKQTDAQTGAMKAQNDAKSDAAKLANDAANRQSEENIATAHLAQEIVIHSADQEKMRIDAARDVQKHTLAAGQAQHSAGMDIRDHALEADKAAHSAAIDVHQALNPPQPKGPTNKKAPKK